jgi:hypothetical protein
VIIAFGFFGYWLGRDVRREAVALEIGRAEPARLPPDMGELPA